MDEEQKRLEMRMKQNDARAILLEKQLNEIQDEGDEIFNEWAKVVTKGLTGRNELLELDRQIIKLNERMK